MGTTVPYTKAWMESLKDGLTAGIPAGLATGVLLAVTKSPFISQLFGGVIGSGFISNPTHREIVAINGAQDAFASLFIGGK